MKALLEKSGINLIIRQNEEVKIFGLTFVNHKNKAVFNGSELGKAYSAKAILERCSDLELKAPSVANDADALKSNEDKATGKREILIADDSLITSYGISIWEALLQPEQLYESTPYPFRLGKKRKRNMKISR